ncbi:MAG TPA: alkaline phosphatase [Myxococcota bacterium]|nr:alkaline phosphatase [Myxococcota bacterium]
MRLSRPTPFCVAALLGLSLALPAARAAEPGKNPWFLAGQEAVAKAAGGAPIPHAKNAILFIGDGMGIATVTAARIYEGQSHGASGEENLLSFETLPYTALSKTYTVDFQVGESSGTMTAMMTGIKTRSGVLGIDDSAARGDFAKAPAAAVPTLLERAADRGLWTGVVTTTTVTHATPGGCYAHTPERNWENDSQLSPGARAAGFPDIARQLVEFSHGDGLQVAMGGGRAGFLPAPAGARRDGRDLVAEWQKRHPDGRYASDRSTLLEVDGEKVHHLLGLFSPEHMSFESERAQSAGDQPSLSEMTAKAIEVLSRSPKGFVLMVEGGRIDHGHHAGNAYRALTETVEFANAIKLALAKTNPAETLIVVTADHSHTLTISGYPKRGNPILGLVVGSIGEGAPSDEPVKDLTGHPYTTLNYANGPGYAGKSDAEPEGSKLYPHRPTKFGPATQGRPDLTSTRAQDPNYLQESVVPLSAETHGGEDVPIYAGGPGALLFHGVQEQNFVFHAIAAALGLPTP